MALDEKDLINRMSELDKDPLSKLKYIYVRVLGIKNSAEIINKHESEHILQEHKKFNLNGETPVTGYILWDYIMLEIDSFYRIVHIYMGEGKSFPTLPTYLKELRKFRNKMPGHRDDKNEFTTFLEWYKFHQEFEKYPGSNLVLKDFEEYCKKVFI